jgi:hypothetical protein
MSSEEQLGEEEIKEIMSLPAFNPDTPKVVLGYPEDLCNNLMENFFIE